MNPPIWTEYVDLVFLIYGFVVLMIYMWTLIYSMAEYSIHINKNRHFDYRTILSFPKLPTISIIAPAYNESKTIIENIKCLLLLQYPELEVIIVNDGSKDNSLEKVIAYFGMIKTTRAFEMRVHCAPIRGVYHSVNPAFRNLIIVDKVNGGKADALNAGINVSKKNLFLAIDVDCIVEPDALLRMVRPFLDNADHVVIASGGVVRVANSCIISEGTIKTVIFPHNFWAKFQAIEYLRAFTLGRMAWSRINGLLIISGAFGLFDRERTIKVGGYDTTTVGEDLELVVRLRKYMCEVEKKKYKVAYIPDPLCWTEVPESYKILERQRNRWTRGAADTIMKHKNMFFNPKYGIIGMLSFPYWVIFEWLSPPLMLFGVLYFILLLIMGWVNLNATLVVSTFAMSLAILYSSVAIYYEASTYNRYQGSRYLFQAFLSLLLEIFIYQPLNTFFALRGNHDYFFHRNKKGWGEMTRTGFGPKTSESVKNKES